LNLTSRKMCNEKSNESIMIFFISCSLYPTMWHIVGYGV